MQRRKFLKISALAPLGIALTPLGPLDPAEAGGKSPEFYWGNFSGGPLNEYDFSLVRSGRRLIGSGMGLDMSDDLQHYLSISRPIRRGDETELDLHDFRVGSSIGHMRFRSEGGNLFGRYLLDKGGGGGISAEKQPLSLGAMASINGKYNLNILDLSRDNREIMRGVISINPTGAYRASRLQLTDPLLEKECSRMARRVRGSWGITEDEEDFFASIGFLPGCSLRADPYLGANLPVVSTRMFSFEKNTGSARHPAAPFLGGIGPF